MKKYQLNQHDLNLISFICQINNIKYNPILPWVTLFSLFNENKISKVYLDKFKNKLIKNVFGCFLLSSDVQDLFIINNIYNSTKIKELCCLFDLLKDDHIKINSIQNIDYVYFKLYNKMIKKDKEICSIPTILFKNILSYSYIAVNYFTKFDGNGLVSFTNKILVANDGYYLIKNNTKEKLNT